MKNLFIPTRSLLIIVGVLFSMAAFSQQEIYSKANQAISGYDPVAYFKESKPVKGTDQFSYVWKGGVWNFSSQENLDAFKSTPERYAPQFGGYCAYGVADGHKAPTSPDAWTIVEGKLFLNYNKDVRELWSKDQRNFIKKANENWPEVKKQMD
jgi:YHS domain-containing protein